MKKRGLQMLDDPIFSMRLPDWITAAPAERLEDAAFRSGAALAHLHQTAARAEVPQALWRARLALSAAEVCAGLAGRREGVVAMRDALHFLRADDRPGPAGEILQHWFRVVARPILVADLGKATGGLMAAQIAACPDAPKGNPVEAGAAVLQAELLAAPRAETSALILADAALAKTLGWEYLLPLLSLGMQSRDLRVRDDALRLVCHRAVVVAAGHAVALAADLVRRVARLRAVAPKLRAQGAEQAVDLFLSQDALAPAALAGIMSDRAARRLCDRLVELGAVRELTGRDSFRLYGV